MPMYEYECTACGHRFERIQKFSDPPIEECPNCGAHEVQKLLSSPAIQFKGTGWYITDYARKGAETKAPADASSDKGGAKEAGESKESGKSKESGESGKSKVSKESKESKSTPPASNATSTPKASGE